ncbi:acyl-CoA synthetase [Cohaesibacter celericrescens]|uniref:Acyl-CoA synthetase n=1 Tax=Cohaesibacter celericrescens TaxID=2067669 RepID=A0A2N5XV09_9HYPH|nr:acyl-CoA synthetase [Cohaesibacter celericrescens]PLW78352.1 acyl-CoA synthetase [Cohaesibacter celericrescens]
MVRFATREDCLAIENDKPYEGRDVPVTIYGQLSRTTQCYPDHKAVSFQLFSGATDRAETLTWVQLKGKVTQAANLFRKLGVGQDDVVAYILPNSNETLITMLGGMVAGIVSPINPMLETEQIAAILRETNARVVVTLRAFPQTDVAEKVAEAVRHAPRVQTILEVDLLRYVTGIKKMIIPLIRPKNPRAAMHHADILSFNKEMSKQPSDRLTYEDEQEDRVAAYFHTGGTTGMPKVAQHTYSGMLYNGWVGSRLMFSHDDNIMCPLPLFHVFACHVIVMSMLASGAHGVFPTPKGYRGDGVFDNFWKLIERWQISFIITVPTALSALMQRPVDADVSSVKTAFSGSAPLPLELYRRFEKATGVNILEGYGLTEATCLVSCNPSDGPKKVGSVGLPFPYTTVKILEHTKDGPVECATDEVGEICIDSPGVLTGSTYTELDKNHDLFHHDLYLRTGDLGRLDEDGYLWITGRAKDLIIRGGHNIDPAEIEEALAGHPSVAFVGAIGQPDAHAGELPCAYVELVDGTNVDAEDLLIYAKRHIHERAAIPKHIEVLPELPKTAVGKVFKPDLRKLAISRVYNEVLVEKGFDTEVVRVIEDKKRGLVAELRNSNNVDKEALSHALGQFTRPWQWQQDQ